MGDRVKVTIHATYTEWVDPDDYDGTIGDVKDTFENIGVDIIAEHLRLASVDHRTPGEFAVTGVEVTEETQSDG